MGRPWACDYHRALHEGREPDKVRCKFFEIGMGRTGTRSVFSAVSKLGIKAVHGTGGCVQCVEDMMPRMEAGRTDMVLYDIYEYCGHLPAFHWEKLADERPDAKFILTLRPVEEWADSAVKKMGRGRPRKYKRSEYIHIKQFGSAKPTRQQLLDGYQRHLDAVLNRFRDNFDRLLIVNVFSMGDGYLWSRLAKFLEVDPPPVMTEFPKKVTPIRLYKPSTKPGE